MAFLVETTPESERDADAIPEWLFSQHAGDTGIRWFLALEDAIASLAIALTAGVEADACPGWYPETGVGSVRQSRVHSSVGLQRSRSMPTYVFQAGVDSA
jgi:plasmid stabilization system protein ParE